MKIDKNFLIWGVICAVFIFLLIKFFINSFSAFFPPQAVNQASSLVAAVISEKSIPSNNYSIPVNAFSDYNAIKTAIKEDNAKQEIARVTIKERNKRIALVIAAAAINPEEDAQGKAFFNSEPISEPIAGAGKKTTTFTRQRYEPTAEEIKDFKASGYIIR